MSENHDTSIGADASEIHNIKTPELSASAASELPDVPPKPLPSRVAETPRTASVLALRQSELYGSAGMNMTGEIIATVPVDLASREIPQVDLWTDLIKDYSDEFLRRNEMRDVEEAVIAGMPESLRPLVYLKTMGVRTHVDEHIYNGLVKKAKLANWENPAKPVSEDVAELMDIYHVSLPDVDNDVAARKFVGGVFPLVAELPGLSKPETLALLFKFGALFSRVSKDEFYYKCSRVLEDNENKMFMHIAKQGVDLTHVFKTVLVDIFSGLDTPVLHAVLDLVVFEGVDFLVRLTAAIFRSHSSDILDTSNDALEAYVSSPEFLHFPMDTVAAATHTEVTIIKYENEFHLMNANAISGNDNELANLKDANEDLVLRISDMQAKIDTLKKTQAEILAQSDEYTTRLADAKEQKAALSKRADELHARYAHLTMKENLNNTIQANRDISSGNADLEAQIEAMKEKVEKKRAKIDKGKRA